MKSSEESAGEMGSSGACPCVCDWHCKPEG